MQEAFGVIIFSIFGNNFVNTDILPASQQRTHVYYELTFTL